MPIRCRCVILMLAPAVALAVVLAESTYAQGRGFRGPPEAVRTRGGAYFVDVTLPDAGEDVTGTDRLAATEHVKNAAKEGNLSLLYLFDPEADEQKHQRFETALLNHPSLNVALKAFKCGRINVSQGDGASEYGRRAPLFAVFDGKGKCVGEVSMHGYKASSGPLLTVLNRAAKGHGKLGLPEFVKEYRSFLNDLTQLEARKTALRSKRAREENKDRTSRSKLARLEKDEAELKKAEEKLLESEEKLLASAKIPPRDANATRVGERRRGGRRR